MKRPFQLQSRRFQIHFFLAGSASELKGFYKFFVTVFKLLPCYEVFLVSLFSPSLLECSAETILNKKNLYLLFADCMKPLLRSEDFHPGRHIKVSSEYEAFGDRRRVVEEGDPWCASPGNRFGEWVQVDLGKSRTVKTHSPSVYGWRYL